MISRHRLIVFLVALVIVLAKNLTAFLIVASFMEGCMLIASTETIVYLYTIVIVVIVVSVFFSVDVGGLVMVVVFGGDFYGKCCCYVCCGC